MMSGHALSWIVLAGCALCLLLSSCGDRPRWEQSYDIDGAWAYADSVTFILPVTDTTSAHDLLLEVTHDVDYPHQNIYIDIHSSSPTGSVRDQRLNVNLAAKSGAWLGQCSREQCRYTVELARRLQFIDIGDYSFTISQTTREDPLQGIYGLTLSLCEID